MGALAGAKRKDYLADTSVEESVKGIPKPLRSALKFTGDVGRVADTVVGAPVEAALHAYENYTPMGKVMKFAHDKLMGVAMSTDVVKDLQHTIQQNPELAGVLGDVAATAELIPYFKGATSGWKNFANTSTDNLLTRLDGTDVKGNNPKGRGGFYTGDPIGAIQSGWSPQRTAKDLLDPQSIANREAKGTGSHRIEEALEAGTKRKNHTYGNLRASKNMRNQQDKALQSDTLIERMPMASGNVRGSVRGGDREGFKELVLSDIPEGHKVPDYIANKFVDNDRTRLGERHGLESKLATGFQAGRGKPTADNAILHVNEPKAAYSDIAREGAGMNPIGGSVGKAISSPKTLTSASGAYGKQMDNWSATEWEDYYKTAEIFERESWLGTDKAYKDAAGSKGVMGAFRRKALPKVVGEQRLGIKEQMPKSAQAPAAAQQAYWKARGVIETYNRTGEGRKPTQNQLNIVKVVEDAKKNNKNSRVSVEKDLLGNPESIHYVGSFLSSEQALGGVGYRIAHDLKNNDLYSNVIDGHDLKGVDPVGGDQLWNISPVQVYKPGRPPKERLDKKGPWKVGMDEKVEKQLQDVEAFTGLPRNKGESGMAYQLRMLSDWDAPVKARHRVQAAGRAGMLAAPLIQTTNQDEGQP